MLNDHHFSSKAKKTIIVKSLALLMLSGCTSASLKTSEHSLESTKHSLVSQRDSRSQDRYYTTPKSKVNRSDVRLGKQEQPKIDKIVTATSKASIANSVRKFDIDPDKFSNVQQSSNSAACRFFKNSANAEALITASPTLSASSDDDGSGSVAIGMNMLDFKKSNLLRASGDAKCRLHEASKKIEATLGLGSELTAYSSAKAKEEYIRKNSSKLNGLKNKANTLMKQGSISRQDANLIKAQVSELYSVMETAKAQADRRSNLPILNQEQIKNRHGALVQATSDLQSIERDLRTNEALELSVSGGYRYSHQFNDDLQQRDNPGAYAKVNVSVRLGAISPHRMRLEDAATTAKLDSLFEENAGVIWKSGFTKRSVERALVHLKRSEQQLQSAVSRSHDTIKNLTGSDRPEILTTLIKTKIKNVQLGAELASVRASIKELNNYQEKIGALSQ